MIALALLLACHHPVEAPAEMDALSSFLYTSWDDEDPEAMQQGVANLLAFAETVDVSGDLNGRSFVVNPFGREEIDAYVDHDNDPLETVGVGVLYLSPYPALTHMQHVRMADQTPVEPSSPSHYERVFTEGDPDCFVDGSCEILRSMNDVLRETMLYELAYDMDKMWRWVETDSGVDALCARSMNVDEAQSGDNIRLLQGYSMDLLLPKDGGSLRYQVTWQQSEIPGLDDEDMQGAIASGVNDVFVLQDEYVAEELR